MAVPGRRNGMIAEDPLLEEEDDEGVLVEAEEETPPHLRDLAAALQLDNLTGSIDEPVEDGDTALHLACLYGLGPCVQLLVERGANLEVKDEDGGIPLHDACAGGFIEIVEHLLNSTNDPDCLKRILEAIDVEGDTPLHHAARGEHVNVIRVLLASGASATKTNIYGKSPSELADPETEARRILEAAASGVACH